MLGQPSMKKAGVLLDVANCKAKFFGQDVELKKCKSGHFSVDILTPPTSTKNVEYALGTS